MTDYRKLRELAEAATPGSWETDVWVDSNSYGWRATGPHHESPTSDDNAEPGCPDEQAAQRDAAFIAAANPTTVLALLDDNERLREAANIAEQHLRLLREDLAQRDEELSTIRASLLASDQNVALLRDTIRAALSWAGGLVDIIAADTAADTDDIEEMEGQIRCWREHPLVTGAVKP